jgi:hypothetical protein
MADVWFYRLETLRIGPEGLLLDRKIARVLSDKYTPSGLGSIGAAQILCLTEREVSEDFVARWRKRRRRIAISETVPLER